MNRKASHGCRSACVSDSAWSCVGLRLLWSAVVVAVGNENAVLVAAGCDDAARAITSAKRTGAEYEMFVGGIVLASISSSEQAGVLLLLPFSSDE